MTCKVSSEHKPFSDSMIFMIPTSQIVIFQGQDSSLEGILVFAGVPGGIQVLYRGSAAFAEVQHYLSFPPWNDNCDVKSKQDSI